MFWSGDLDSLNTWMGCGSRLVYSGEQMRGRERAGGVGGREEGGPPAWTNGRGDGSIPASHVWQPANRRPGTGQMRAGRDRHRRGWEGREGDRGH